LIHVSVTVVGGKTTPLTPPVPEKTVEFTWKYVTPPPERKLLELDKELFLHLVMGLING
jgi:hypothetical protein